MAFTNISLRHLWKALSAVFSKMDPGMLEPLTLISEGSSTSWRDIMDHHGNAIRNTNDNANPNTLEKELGEQPCQCNILFPDFIDPTVSHVRTNSTESLGPVLGPLASKGLNFISVLQVSVRSTKTAKSCIRLGQPRHVCPRERSRCSIL